MGVVTDLQFLFAAGRHEGAKSQKNDWSNEEVEILYSKTKEALNSIEVKVPRDPVSGHDGAIEVGYLPSNELQILESGGRKIIAFAKNAVKATYEAIDAARQMGAKYISAEIEGGVITGFCLVTAPAVAINAVQVFSKERQSSISYNFFERKMTGKEVIEALKGLSVEEYMLVAEAVREMSRKVALYEKDSVPTVGPALATAPATDAKLDVAVAKFEASNNETLIRGYKAEFKSFVDAEAAGKVPPAEYAELEQIYVDSKLSSKKTVFEKDGVKVEVSVADKIKDMIRARAVVFSLGKTESKTAEGAKSSRHVSAEAYESRFAKFQK